MEMFISQIEKNIEAMQEQFRKAGLLSFTVTQIWNKQGKFRVATTGPTAMKRPYRLSETAERCP